MVRNDFVSNSSSSSFVVNKEKHGCWFRTLISIIRTIDSQCIDLIRIDFDSKVDVLNLFYKFKESIDKNKWDDRFSISVEKNTLQDGTFKEKITIIFRTVDLINIIRLNEDLMKHIEQITVDLEYDLGAIEDRIYRQLKDTGLEFEWYR